MAVNYKREQFRKWKAKKELNDMCARYDNECGECVVRQMTEEEKNKYGVK